MPKYKKGEYRDQFVIANIHDLDNPEDVIYWSKKFALLLKKGLILLYISDPQYNCTDQNEAAKKLEAINNTIDLPYTHSFAAVKGNTKEIVHKSGEMLNGVMIVSSFDKLSKSKSDPGTINNVIRDFYESRIAYFLFTKQTRKENDFKEIVLSMNALKESKEKVLWASYFGRFANSVVDIFYHRYADEYLQKQLNLNIGFARRMFKNFKIETRNLHSLTKKQTMDLQAILFAQKENKDLCIFQTTANKGIIELLTGLPEKKVLKNMESVPVLFLNRRDDIFVMCE